MYYCSLTTAKSTLSLLTLTCLSSYEQRKRFVSIKITGPEFAEKIVSKEIFLTPSVLSAGSITSPQRSISWQHWHSSALVAKATERLEQKHLIPKKVR